MSSQDKTAAWVAELNALAREMDEIAYSMHPSAWPEELAKMIERYKKLAAAGPK